MLRREKNGGSSELFREVFSNVNWNTNVEAERRTHLDLVGSAVEMVGLLNGVLRSSNV
jgi:hypothetical protein